MAEPVGTCPCIAKGCDELAKLYRFGARSDDERRRRFAGKLYAVCPAGHSFGRNGDSQEYILSEGKVWGVNDGPAAERSPPVEPAKPAPAKAPEKQAPRPVTAAEEPKPKRGGFGFFQ